VVEAYYESSMTGDDVRQIPLFAGLSDEGLARVGSQVTEITVEPGQILAVPGDAGSGMFVLLEGTVSVELHAATIELRAPDFVGELALLLPDVRRVGRVRATTEVRCLSLPRAEFDTLVESEPSFSLALLRGLASRLVADADRR
jgi:CRP-like cAMP-binding protein